MTTAHRPTFNPARGGTDRNEGALSKLSQQYSARDMPAHKTLKYRQIGQAHPDEVGTKDLRRDIQERESTTTTSKRALGGSSQIGDSKKSRLEALSSSANADADDPLDEMDEDLSDSDADSDEDDDAELMAELERIKKERAAERAQKEQQEHEEQEQIRQDNILHGNPLLNSGDGSSDFKVKRRWDDDVIFKNCARGLDERKKDPTFINDAIRSEFHKKFMEKYIK